MRGRRLAREGNEEVVEDVCQCEFQGEESRETQRRRERGGGQTIEGKSKSKKKRSLKKGGQKKKKRYTCAMVAGKIKEYGEDAWYIL